MSPLPMYQPGVPHQSRVSPTLMPAQDPYVDDISNEQVLAFQQALWDDMRVHAVPEHKPGMQGSPSNQMPMDEATLDEDSMDSWWDDLDMDAIQPTLQRLAALLSPPSPADPSKPDFTDDDSQFSSCIQVTRPTRHEADIFVNELANQPQAQSPSDWSTLMIKDILDGLSHLQLAEAHRYACRLSIVRRFQSLSLDIPDAQSAFKEDDSYTVESVMNLVAGIPDSERHHLLGHLERFCS